LTGVRYAFPMPDADSHAPADLVFSLHRPLRASLAECLARWRSLDAATRAGSYLVVHGRGDVRRTLAADRIAELARAVA
jgi:hypothetical protein